jgi:hypothetical protein
MNLANAAQPEKLNASNERNLRLSPPIAKNIKRKKLDKKI